MLRISETVKALLIINVIVFVGAMSMQETATRLFALFYFDNPSFEFWQPVTSMFMHGGITHIAFNMIGLWMFGTPLEQRWGTKKFLFFYFSAGLGAALVHMGANYIELQMAFQEIMAAGFTQDHIDLALNTGKVFVDFPDAFEPYYRPAVGASGAVYGIMVAFALYHPNAKLALIFFPVPVAAKYFVPVLLIAATIFGVSGTAGGIAHWAHIGGAVFGFLMAWSWRKSGNNLNRWN